MRAKAFIVGMLVGSAITTAVFFIFGDPIRDNVAAATKEVGQRVENVGKKLEQESRRVNEQVRGSIGLGKPEFPDLPPLPDPPAPPATRISGQGSDEISRQQRGRVSGRGDTVVTGELSPTKVGKKTLLGRL